MYFSFFFVFEYYIVVSFECSLKYLNYLVEVLKILVLKIFFFYFSFMNGMKFFIIIMEIFLLWKLMVIVFLNN